MKKRITPAERRHQDYLRTKGLKVGKVYMMRLARLRHREVKRVLDMCAEIGDTTQWGRLVENTLSENGYLFDWFTGLYLDCGLPQAKSITRDLSRGKAEDPSLEWETGLRDYATRRAGENIVSITGTLKDELRALIAKEIAEDVNDSIEKLTRRILKDYDTNLALWQCRRIAQTETMIGLAEAGNIAAKSLEIPFTKEWCISGVGNTRETHKAMDGIVVDENDYFVLPDCYMQFPHDSSMNAPAAEIINCACSCIRRPK